ncbi:4-hydroxybenzoate 3-monooxygenase [Rhizocola hellebori]|uniref:4-hydroxybenzoate 3-monooxygenase n=1 Tax=Rhizocola hellebori TaxID=1392758 RepID=A0A8J3Q308_9ACTN|nr:4-hydroxybenzoate 3-monooxygenase [Rhizocola hellebori]GIH03003.1 4-hydroxybenzoate 3-monooxygenase [Rhizocola hellebori]
MTVAIVGAGASGLTLAALLQRAGVSFVVLEVRSRSYVEERQRAGVLDYSAGQVYVKAGLEEAILGGVPLDDLLEIRYEGSARFLNVAQLAGGQHSYVVPQQLLVRRLIAMLVDSGADIRFGVSGVELHGIDQSRPRVTYLDEHGVPGEIECDFVAGCDGFHGVSRTSIPQEALTTYTFEHDIGWFTVLADSPAPKHALLAISSHGFAAQFARGPKASRFYLQHRPDAKDRLEDDEWIWTQLRLRLGDDGLPAGAITSRDHVEMRSFVVEPISYGRLFLVGDAAHIITPMGAKGMNLAVVEAAALAEALVAAQQGDSGRLASYSATCLHRTWNYQEFSRWMTEMVHDAGDDSLAGPFRRQLAKARLDRLFTSPPAAAAFADLMAGIS